MAFVSPERERRRPRTWRAARGLCPSRPCATNVEGRDDATARDCALRDRAGHEPKYVAAVFGLRDGLPDRVETRGMRSSAGALAAILGMFQGICVTRPRAKKASLLDDGTKPSLLTPMCLKWLETRGGDGVFHFYWADLPLRIAKSGFPHSARTPQFQRPANFDVGMYNHPMSRRVIHISEAEAASDFASLLDRVRAGAEVVIENGTRPVAVLQPAEPAVRLLSDSLRLAREHGSAATLDEDFAKDVEAAVESHREPLNPPAWD